MKYLDLKVSTCITLLYYRKRIILANVVKVKCSRQCTKFCEMEYLSSLLSLIHAIEIKGRNCIFETFQYEEKTISQHNTLIRNMKKKKRIIIRVLLNTFKE